MDTYKVARLFRNGRSQAVRLPVQFEFDADQVYIRQTENGDLIISKRKYVQDNWNHFFGMLKNTPVPDNFMDKQERDQGISDRDPFEGVE
ncbi:AbrB/MazE/SpoVT family DNA-binding domain-containing protein [Salmonella enterica]|nr:AbrB/MazE/SpoVT family DNA-binding domain-containing protein [Salmonella enterica]EGL4359774.1 AbrB/MazE/SpoVT family DNA-binding domain-containing protein [Salmonella enterica]EGL4382727.1 AbrB/MazE/SpoVT family DNA-binding domain-containing protein [Salmonella enterica]EGL4487973.1 AbrB/MazE/SpoVT family DNA-binding domain-containing protein [Salmonella enterica]EGL4515133.1 AbrB/MazE/SpoVT family DNA-binding domain-containing protein [Salmonella enterica]